MALTARKILGDEQMKSRVWLYGISIVLASILIFISIKSKLRALEDPYRYLPGTVGRGPSLEGRIYICAVVSDVFQMQKWLGSDYGTLVLIGGASKNIVALYALPADKERAMQRVKSLVKLHHLHIYQIAPPGGAASNPKGTA